MAEPWADCLLSEYFSQVSNGFLAFIAFTFLKIIFIIAKCLRPVFNFTPGLKLAPRGELCPQRVKLYPRGEDPLFAPLFFQLLEWSPLWVNEEVNNPPRGKLHPWGPHNLVKNRPLSRVDQRATQQVVLGYIVEVIHVDSQHVEIYTVDNRFPYTSLTSVMLAVT
jgi:hypothetical protein